MHRGDGHGKMGAEAGLTALALGPWCGEGITRCPCARDSPGSQGQTQVGIWPPLPAPPTTTMENSCPFKRAPRLHSETEQDLKFLPFPTTSSACLRSVENLSQRSSIREMRNTEAEGSSQRRPESNRVVSRHSRGPSVLSQGLDNILSHILRAVL